MELLGTLVDDRIIISPSFIPLFFFFSSKHARYFTLRFMQIPFGSFYDPKNCRIFSLSLFFLFPSRVELDVWYWTRRRCAANRGVEDLWDCGTSGIYVGIFNVFVNMVFWKFDNNRRIETSRKV